MSTPITLLPGTLPFSCYPDTPQELNVAIISLASAFLNDNFPGVYVSDSAPPPNFQDRAWFNLTNLKWYHFQNANWWRWADSTPGPSGERMMWFDTEASLWSYQGGDGTDPSVVTPALYTGSLWQKDATFDAKIPIASGTLPSGLVLAQGNTGGVENVTLTAAQLAKHTHVSPVGSDGYWSHAFPLGSGSYNVGVGVDTLISPNSGQNGTVADPLSTDQPHTNMPPYVTVIIAKRTIRAYVL